MRRGYVAYGVDGKIRVDRGIARSSTLAAELLLRSIKNVFHYAKGRLLDVGCGESPYQLLFEPYVLSYIRTDQSTSRHNLEGIDFYSSALELPLQDGSFDTVLCAEVLEHLPNAFVGFHELVRVTKHGGIIIASVPFVYGMHEAPFDYFRPTEYLLKMLAEKEKLDLVELIRRGGALAVIFNIFVKIWAVALESIRFGCLRPVRRLLEVFLVYLPQEFILRLRGDPLSHMFTLGYVAVFKKP